MDRSDKIFKYISIRYTYKLLSLLCAKVKVIKVRVCKSLLCHLKTKSGTNVDILHKTSKNFYINL